MRVKLLQGIGILWIAALMAACASSGDTQTSGESGPPAPPFSQVKAAPDSFKGQTLVLGGQVLAARRMKDGTRIEVLQLPLNDSQQPTLDLMKSEVRFVAIQREFLDPATIPQGTFLTITGELTGSMTLPLDETDYTYPVIDIKTFRTWIPSQDSNLSRIRPYPYYYSPFWHPYWGPYGRFPYYW
ncbi:MAG: Slp family lipoprotein [Nitrospira sp.]|nr:Slp family lipoprotein [Nitrospira sp.]